jgi:hypothetical protein
MPDNSRNDLGELGRAMQQMTTSVKRASIMANLSRTGCSQNVVTSGCKGDFTAMWKRSSPRDGNAVVTAMCKRSSQLGAKAVVTASV